MHKLNILLVELSIFGQVPIETWDSAEVMPQFEVEKKLRPRLFECTNILFGLEVSLFN